MYESEADQFRSHTARFNTSPRRQPNNPRQIRTLQSLVAIQYSRNDMDFHRGTFRVRGDVVEVFPGYGDMSFRIELWGDDIDRILEINPSHPIVEAMNRIFEEDRKSKVLED